MAQDLHLCQCHIGSTSNYIQLLNLTICPQLMSVDGLTRENVASHLQKYRLQLKRQPGDGSEDQGLPGTSLDGNSDINTRLDAPGNPSSIDEDGGIEAKGNQQIPVEPLQNPKGTASQTMGQPQGNGPESGPPHPA